MFGEYAQIATYLPSVRDPTGAGDYPANNLPPHLLPPPPISQPLWATGGPSRRGRGADIADDRSSLEDFVMVAEFSEIEGPKPVLTIPKDAGGNIDQNQLSVKLMAVDHQTSSEGFSISEDTQVVLSDDESGVSAFVHHFVLYDNQARGFVRPYCMVFISADIRKIMMFYEELSSQFKRAARFLKYGNRLLFVKDLERHLQDLEHTKGYLLNQVGRMRLKDSEGSESEQSKSRINAENELYKGLQNIRQSTTEIRDILTILKPLLHDRRLECRFRALEDRAFQCGNEELAHADKLSLQEDWFADNLYSDGNTAGPTSGSLKESYFPPVSLFKSAPSHTPLLVETKKAKRFNSPLRGLHELCSWGAKEGLRKLRCIHEYFKKDAMVLEIERNEIRLMEPSNSMILHGHCITSNVLAGVSLRGSSLCLSEDSSSNILSAERLKRWPSITSNDTLESFKSVDSFLSLQDEEDASLFSFASNDSSPCVTTSASAQDFMSAPTSPMTEEVAFPPVVSPESKPPNHATPSAVSLPQTPTTTTTTAADSSSLSPPPSAENTCDPVTAHREATSTHSTVERTLARQQQQQPPSQPQDLLSPSPVTSPPSSSVGSPPVAIPATHNTDSNGATMRYDTQATFGSAVDSTLSNTTSAGLSQTLLSDSSCNGGQVVMTSEDQQAQGELPAGCEGSPGPSRIMEIFQQQALGDRQDQTQECWDSGITSETTGPLSKFLNNGSICGQSGSSEVASNNRTPSFVPLMATNPGQNIRAAHRQKSSDPSPSCSPEKSADLDRWRLELTDSCTVGQTEDGCCDIENAAEGGCNMFSASTPSSESCLWKPKNGVYTAGDVTNCLGPGRPGYGILEVLSSYNHLHSVLFSLMTGRTVLVVGPAKMEVEVTKIVTALSIFLPDTKRKQHCVVDWMNRPLKVTDLTRLRLAGICRSEKRSLGAAIPLAVKQYSTIMDVECRLIMGPNYQGSMLNCVLQQKKPFKTDAQYVAFIHSWLMELSNKAFIFYHSFCLGEAGGLTHSHSVEKHREQYNATICCLMNRLGVRDHDITIVEYLAEKVKLSQLEPHIWAGVDKGDIVHPLAISSRRNHMFRC